VKVPPEALEAARAMFDRPAIFGRRCPRVVDRLDGEAQQRLAAGDAVGAQAAYRSLLRLDPHQARARMGLGACALRSGDQAAARNDLGSVATDPNLARLDRAAAEEQMADLDLAFGDLGAARRGYDAVARLVLDGDRLRTLELKRSIEMPLARRAVAALLVGSAREGSSFGVAAALLGEWAGHDPEDGTPRYLIGRNLFQQGQWEAAARALDEALERRIELPRLRREAFRVRAVLGCAQGDRARARAAYQRYLAEPGESEARREGMRRFAARCGL
jgi:tetratricopeptide (TPR) repeat protein